LETRQNLNNFTVSKAVLKSVAALDVGAKAAAKLHNLILKLAIKVRKKWNRSEH
jgi:hypothetical protein